MRRKEGPTNGNGAGHIKFRVIEFEIDGGNDTLAEGIKALTTALQKSPVALTPGARTSLLAAPKIKSGTTAIEEPETQETATGSEEELEETAEGETDLEEEVSGNGKPKKPRPAPRAPKFLSELNLTTASTKLADFVAQKNPTAVKDKYLVIAEWFKEYMQLPEITLDHIYTAYDFLGWKSQLPNGYLGQPLIDLRADNLLDKGEKRGRFKINWNGTTAVTKMGSE
jgi:hypothetical protein